MSYFLKRKTILDPDFRDGQPLVDVRYFTGNRWVQAGQDVEIKTWAFEKAATKALIALNVTFSTDHTYTIESTQQGRQL